MTHSIRLVIADDHPIVRQGLRQVIEKDAGLQIVAEAGDGQAALEQIKATQPRVAILDIDMPVMSGFEVARALTKLPLAVEIIFLTVHCEAATSGGLSISTDGGASFTNYTTASGLGSNLALDVFATATGPYVATAGGVSLYAPNAPPLITAGGTFARQQGSAALKSLRCGRARSAAAATTVRQTT